MINRIRAGGALVARAVPVVAVGALFLGACGDGDGLSAEEQAIAEEWADELVRDSSDDSVIAIPRDEALCATEKVVAGLGAEQSAAYLAEDLDVLGDDDLVYPEEHARLMARVTDECVDWEPLIQADIEAGGIPTEQAACVAEAYAAVAEDMMYNDLVGLDIEDVIDLEQVAIDCGVEF